MLTLPGSFGAASVGCMQLDREARFSCGWALELRLMVSAGVEPALEAWVSEETSRTCLEKSRIHKSRIGCAGLFPSQPMCHRMHAHALL